MTVLVWIAAGLGIVAALVLVVVVGALVSLLRVEGRWAPGDVSGRGRWGVIGVEVDGPADRLVVRLLGLRVARTSLKRDGADEPSGAEPKPKRQRQHGAGPRLSMSSYRRLARTGWRELRRAARHLHVDRLRLEATVASDDPAWTGEVYGFGCAALGALRGWWPHAELHLDADFVATEPRGAAELALSVRPVRLVPGVARMGWTYWMERRRSRRRV
jgi:hypothetical protein